MAVNRATTRRDDKGRFLPGNKSGGRPVVPDDIKGMLKAAVPDAAQLLIDTMMDTETKQELRIKCAETIIERVYGKATQPIDGEIAQGIIIKFADEISNYAN